VIRIGFAGIMSASAGGKGRTVKVEGEMGICPSSVWAEESNERKRRK